MFKEDQTVDQLKRIRELEYRRDNLTFERQQVEAELSQLEAELMASQGLQARTTDSTLVMEHQGDEALVLQFKRGEPALMHLLAKVWNDHKDERDTR